MWSLLRAFSLMLTLSACAVVAQRIDQDPVLNPRQGRIRDRDLKSDEPTCEQLKAMWRFSKRQARAPEILNEVSNYRDPLLFNEWPIYPAMPRAAPRFRYQYPSVPREAYGRVVTKAPANVVRTPDYDEVSKLFGMLSMPHQSGKILRFAGPSRVKGPNFMIPPQKNRFEALKKLIRQENGRELYRQFEVESKPELKEFVNEQGDDYGYVEQEPRGLQPLVEYPSDEPSPTVRQQKKPPNGSRQVSQFSRYSDVFLPPQERRSFYHPYFDYIVPEFLPYAY